MYPTTITTKNITPLIQAKEITPKKSFIPIAVKNLLTTPKLQNIRGPSPPSKINHSASSTTSIYNKSSFIYTSNLINRNQVDYAVRSVNTKMPSTVASTLTSIPNVFYATKRIIADEVAKNSQNLSKVKNGSILLDTRYDDMAEFKFDSIWKEMTIHQPFLVDIFSAVSGIKLGIESIPKKAMVKFCFIYSILMNIKWNRLSLMQKMNTTLMLEGGGSRKVCTSLFGSCIQVNLVIFHTH